jgi:hypothetical protein
MAVKKPIYRYQYKPTAATYFKPVLGEKEQLAKSVGTQVTNLEQRFKNVGIPTETGAKEADQRNIIEKALNLKADQNMLMDVLEVLNRPTQAVTNVLSSLGDQDKRDVLTAAWEGLSGQKEIGARQALANLTGDKNILKIKEDKNSKLDDIGQFVIDLGLEIVADPTTWITMGVGAAKKAGVKAAKEASEALYKKAADIPKILDGVPAGILRQEKEALIKQATDLLKPKPTLGQKVLSTVDGNVREWTRKAIRNLEPGRAREVVKGIRTLRNFTEKVGGAFNALKNVGSELRGQLDKVFGTANYKLDVLKTGVKSLDEQIETIANKYAGALDAGGQQARKAYRSAVEELYEVGIKIDPKTGTVKVGLVDTPRGKIFTRDIAADIGDSSKNYQFISRKISDGIKGNRAKVMRNVNSLVKKINETVGEGALNAYLQDGFVVFRLNFDDNVMSGVLKNAGLDDVPLTGEAKLAAIGEVAEKYQKALKNLDVGSDGVTRKFSSAIDLDKVDLSKEAQEILKGDPEELSAIFKNFEDIQKKADDLMSTSVDGVKYDVEGIVEGKKELERQKMRYVRRIRTKEYLLELSRKNTFEANPLMREVVSGTGRELNERLYRGTTREYNEVLKTFFNATDDRFAQDLYESAIDYIKVADSRFSMTEVTRLIFGLDAFQGYKFKDGDQLVSSLPKEIQEEALAQGLLPTQKVKWEYAGKFKANSDWAQDAQFLKPVDEMMGDIKKFDPKAKKPDVVKVTKSDVVTKEMADEFAKRNPNHRILNDGFVYMEGDKVVGGEFKSLFDSIPKDLQKEVLTYLKDTGMLGKKMGIHNSAYNILKNAQNAYKVNLNVGVKFFDKFLNFWKGVTLLSPSFHIRNFIGNWTNMSLAGLNPAEILTNTKEAWEEIIKRDEILKKIANGTASVADEVALASSNTYISGLASARRGVRDLENLAELRKYSPDLKRKLGSGLKGQYDNLIKTNFKLAERADEVQRLAMFKALKKKGFTDAQSIQRVREVLFDYGKLTGFEKDVMKRIFPFYTFMKENLQFQFKNILQNSGRYKNLFRSYKHYLEEVADLDEKEIPDYMTGNMWLPLPFTFNKDDKEAISMLKLNLPASDFLEFVEDPLKKGVSSIAIPIKFSWEFMTGVDTFTGAPIQRYPGERSLDRESDSLFKFLRNEKGEFDITKNPVIKKFTDDLGFRTLRRPLTAILDSIDTILGKQNVATGLFDVLEQTGITTTVKKEDINLTALYQQLEYLRNLKKLYEQNTGQTLPSQREAAGYQFKPK